ncbi:MAG: sugar ABC transporter ATP-binding protein, partial [Armatimonadota bacterium]|nr:sugar ABC transporter ATP-binding protein [Armatimonadota bacterium]
GEVMALAGENGAGKSTLIKILAGAYPKDAGEIRLGDTPVEITGPHHAQQLGIAVIYQEFNLVPGLDVAQNIFLGREPIGRIPGFIDRRRLYRDAEAVLQRIGARLDPRALVRHLSVADQQMVEIAKAVAADATILVMDEPTAALTEREEEALFALIRSLKAKGTTILYISHRLDEIFAIADRVTVLRDGRRIQTLSVNETNRAELIRLMVGRELSETFPRRAEPQGEVALRVRGLRRRGAPAPIDLEVRRGEILGIAGLVGAGRTELARALFGADPVESGEVLLDGQPLRIRSPADAIAHGIALAPEDRKQQGLVLTMNVRDNITLAALNQFCWMGFIRGGEETRRCLELIHQLGVRTTGPLQPVRNLSGGNQQKVVLAKWLATSPRVLVLDEPTRGIDVGAKAEIYRLMDELARSGVAIVMISSELPELLGMSDRVLVMHEGRVTGHFSRSEATQERVMHAATGSPGG